MNRYLRAVLRAAPTGLWLSLWSYLYLVMVLLLWVAITVGSTGWRPLVLTSGSMSPTIRPGDVVLVSEVAEEDVVQRAVVTYLTSDGDRVTHRVVEVGEGTVRTRGDANPSVDPEPVPLERIEGVARLVVPFVGMPFVWWADGELVPLGAWLVLTAGGAALAVARSARRRDEERRPRRAAVEVTQRAVRRVRGLLGVIVLSQYVIDPERFRVAGDAVPSWLVLVLTLAVLGLTNLASWRSSSRGRADMRIALLELTVDTCLVVALTTATGTDGIGWALFAMPIVEAAARFRLAGALVHWLVLAGSTLALRLWVDGAAGGDAGLLADLDHLADQLSVLLLVVIPAAHLAEQQVTEVLRQRRATTRAEDRGERLQRVVDVGRQVVELERPLFETLSAAACELGFVAADVAVQDAPQEAPRVVAATSGLVEQPLPQPGAPGSGLRPSDVHLAGVVIDADDPDPDDREALTASPWGAVVRLTRAAPDGTRISVRAVTATGAEPDPGAIEALGLLLGQAVVSLQNRSLVDELRELHEHVRHEADHDALTGLPNRAQLLRRLEELVTAAPPDTWSAVLFLDLNGFKPVNDRLGHEAGDELLRAVAGRLCGRLAAGDLVARLGGDEFTILLGGLPDPDAADVVAERVVRAIEEPFDISGEPVRISASVGIAVAHRPVPPAELLRRADVAMYAAKRERSAVRTARWREELDVAEHRRGRLQADMDQAFADGSLHTSYQPIVRPTDGDGAGRGAGGDVVVVGYEALLRWAHPALGEIPPGEVVTAAQQSGRAGQLRRWVLDHACRDLHALQRSATTELFVSVNVTSVDALDPALAEEVVAAVAGAGLTPSQLLLELSEPAATDDLHALGGTLGALAAMGTRLVLDDFGAGRTSLVHLRRLPIAGLKLHRTLLTGAASDEEDRLVLHAVVRLAHELGIQVVAEGIESPVQAQLARDAGADLLQGYLFGPPRPLAAVAVGSHGAAG